MIPRVIHYCWFGGGELPAAARRCLASWAACCPDYEVRRWDETNFDVGRCRFAREAHAAGRWAFVSDYARLRIVHDHGGIYLDTDVELVRPLDALLRHAAFFGFQQDGTIATGLGFGAEAGHRFVAMLLEGYEAGGYLGPDGRPDATPCPVRDAAAFARLGVRLDGSYQEIDGVAILPADHLCPKSYESGRVHRTARTLAIHHFEASWHGDLERADLARRRRYARLAGEMIGPWLHRAETRATNLAIKVARFLGMRP